VCGVIKPSFERWHNHLGHRSFSIVQRAVKDSDLPYLAQEIKDSMCDACQRAKNHQLPYPKSISISKQPLELVFFFDVWGPSPKSAGRYKYYVSFIDDYNKFTWIYLIQFRSEVFQKNYEFQALVEQLFDRKILSM
jgi:hypothetical protein